MPKWVSGVVMRGDGRGAALGFPTANLKLLVAADRPEDGVWACWVTVGTDAKMFQGALHVGPRPTFAGSTASVEVHILDYPHRDLYGERLSFQPVRKLRDIQAFASAEVLIRALEEDCENARRYLQ